MRKVMILPGIAVAVLGVSAVVLLRQQASPAAAVAHVAPALPARSARPPAGVRGSVHTEAPPDGRDGVSSASDDDSRIATLSERRVSTERSLEIARLVAALDPARIPALLAKAAGLDAEVRGALLQRWVETAPREAMSYAVRLKDGDERAGNLAWMMERWGQSSIADARAWMEALPPGRERNVSAAALIPEIAKSDRASALALLAALPAADAQTPAAQMFRDWGRGEEAGAAFGAAQSLSGSTRYTALQATLEAAVSSDPRQAAELWSQLPASRERSELLPTLTEAMAKLDPKATVEWAAYYATGAGGQQAVGQAVTEWLRADPVAAQAWILSRGTQAQRDDLLAYTASALSSVKPDLAMDLAKSVVSEEERQSALRAAADVWSRRDADSFWGWISKQADSSTLAAVIPAAVQQIAANAPIEAAALVAKLEPGEIRDVASRTLVSSWAAADPGAAAAWSQSNVAEGWERIQAMGLSLASMIERDSAGAEAFAASLPGGAERDGVLEFAAERMAARDPQAALRLADTIGDEPKRYVVLQQAYLSYLKIAPAQASAWLSSANIPAEIKTKFVPQP